MRSASLLANILALSWLITSGSTTPFEHDQLIEPLPDTNAHQERRQAGSYFPVTGITDAGVHPRMEIRDLARNTDMMNLFLVGLYRFQQTNQQDKFSYYQIAGIHGRPYLPWDGSKSAPGVAEPGYCTHTSNLFAPWHRPYLALFEQTLFQHIIDVVNEYPAGADRQRLAAVAMAWRLPFLDWAARPPDGGSVLPSILSQPTVSVKLPNGTTTMPNPLYSYRFSPPPGRDFQYDPFASWKETKRAPTGWVSNAQSQNQLVAAALDNNRNSVMNRAYILFSQYDNFTRFSNEAWDPMPNQRADSLESLHDTIHGLVGASGHMTYLDYSAFDPIFWLHHCMLDRLFALWQTVHSNSYVEPAVSVAQSYAIGYGTKEDVNSPLAPFHRDRSGAFHTPATVVSVSTFGYTYPELAGKSDAASVRTAINKLYGSNAASGGPVKRSAHSQRDSSAAPVRKLSGAASRADVKAAPGMVVDGQYQHYVANIISEKFAVNGSYSIYFFLGAVDDDPKCWPIASNLVGTHGVFAGLPVVDAQASGLQAGSGNSLLVSASIPLTDGLLIKVAKGELSSMKREIVAAYLQQNLRWRAAALDGSAMPVDEQDVRITILSAKVQPAKAEDEFPVWDEYVELKFPNNEQPTA